MSDQTRRTPVSIVMPAYRAEDTIVRAVKSVCAQTHAHWELLVIADDATDYETVLGRAGIDDPRIRHLATGNIGSGSPKARNIGLDAARHAYSAILDADDALMPEKLASALPHLEAHGIVSSAIRIEMADGRAVRTVGAGANRVLGPAGYKFVNFSMDSMLVHDRQRADPRYDASLPCLVDIDFLIRLFAASPTVYHLGAPLHVYTKQPASVSNKPGASAQMVATKQLLLDRLASGGYPLADPAGREGLARFYTLSLAAEQSYGARLAETPGLLFEDHLEPLIASDSALLSESNPEP